MNWGVFLTVLVASAIVPIAVVACARLLECCIDLLEAAEDVLHAATTFSIVLTAVITATLAGVLTA